jgi:hypothetical protein
MIGNDRSIEAVWKFSCRAVFFLERFDFAVDQMAGAWLNLWRLWAMASSPSSVFTFSRPRRKNLLNPLFCFMFPNTASTFHSSLRLSTPCSASSLVEYLLQMLLQPFPPKVVDRIVVRPRPARQPHEMHVLSTRLLDLPGPVHIPQVRIHQHHFAPKKRPPFQTAFFSDVDKLLVACCGRDLCSHYRL